MSKEGEKVNWILLLVLFLIFTEVSFIWITRMKHIRIDIVDALTVKIVSAIIGAIGVGILYFGSRAAVLYGIDLLIVQLTEFAVGAAIVVVVIAAIIGWILINKYIANKFVIKERR